MGFPAQTVAAVIEGVNELEIEFQRWVVFPAFLRRGGCAAAGAVDNVREALLTDDAKPPNESVRFAEIQLTNRPVCGFKERAHCLSRSHPVLKRRGISPILIPLPFVHTFYDRRPYCDSI